MMNINQQKDHIIQENGNSILTQQIEPTQFSNAVWINYHHKKNLNSLSQSKNRSKNNDNPTKRWGHSSTIYNKQMIIFGGRQSTKSLANIYSFDFESNLWQKIETLGQTPPARDSHSTILVRIN